MSANPPSEHYAKNASCSAAPGMPSEETMARAIAEALRRKRIPDEIWNQMVAIFRELEKKFPDYAEGFSGSTNAFRGARAILSLIRPAFEAKDAEIGQAKAAALLHGADVDVMNAALATAKDLAQRLRAMEARALSAEAKLAQAVEALSRAKDEIVRTADDLSMHSPAVNLVEEIATIIGQPALNSRAIVRDAASAAARGEATTLASGKEKP